MYVLPQGAKDCNFNKQLRLTSKGYRAVFRHTQVKKVSSHLLLLAKYNFIGIPRLGIVIPKKKCKKTTSRNRIKRVIREYFRLYNYPTSIGLDLVVISRNSVGNLTNEELISEMSQLWDYLKIVNKSISLPQAQIAI